MKKLAATILLAAALLAACGKTGDSTTASANVQAPESGHAGHGGMSGMGQGGGRMDMAPAADKAAADNVKAVFTLSNEKPQPGRDTTVTVKIRDRDGKPVEQFDIEHEKRMHMIIVSRDLSFFHHIHPEYQGQGEFTATTRFPSAGEFELIADFAPSGMGAMSRSRWITVPGSAPAARPIEVDTSLTKVVDGKEVTLSLDHLTADRELSLDFNIRDAGTKQPVTDLQPYLGAIGHVVILNRDGGEYLHVHPASGNSAGPDAKFMVAFPHSGVFKIWGQFQQNGKVFTVPFVVKIP